MLTDTSRWSHARGNGVVPSRWQATDYDRDAASKLGSSSRYDDVQICDVASA